MATQSTGLKTEQRLKIRMTQKQKMYVHLMEMNAQEFEEAIDRQIQENPALEEEPTFTEEQQPVSSQEQSYISYPGQNYAPADNNREFAPADTTETLYDYLRVQVSEKKMPEEIRKAVMYLIDCIDSSGYLRRSLAEIHNDMLFHHDMEVSMDTLERALTVIKTLEPAGIGARDLKECLYLQLERMPQSEVRDDALKIIDKKFEAFTNKHFHKIISGLRMKEDRMERAMELIRTLNPKPGNTFGYGDSASNIIIPDFIIARDEQTDEMTITLNNRIPELKIQESFDQAYKSLKSTGRGKQVKGNEYIVYNYREAKDFIDVVKQRQQTLYKVMAAIVHIQREYFETEDVYKLKPMMIKDIEKLTGLDKSTISRVTNRKFVSLPWGVYPLRFFFSDSIGDETDSSALTNRKIEAEIRQIVKDEDKRHPLSDEKIRQAMESRGYPISRRTVAKYRERCGIPVARLRK